MTTDLDTPLALFPHYTDDSIPSSGRTVFGAPSDGLFYSYMDRLEGDQKGRCARFIANELGANPKTGRWISHFLAAFHGHPVKLKHVIVGVNRSNGYPWQAFGYVIDHV